MWFAVSCRLQTVGGTTVIICRLWLRCSLLSYKHQTNPKVRKDEKTEIYCRACDFLYIKPVQMTVKNNYGLGEKSKLFETRQLKEERQGWSQAAGVIWISGVTKKANHVTWKCVCSASPQTWTQIRPKLPFWTHSLINLLQQLVILAKVSVGWLCLPSGSQA